MSPDESQAGQGTVFPLLRRAIPERLSARRAAGLISVVTVILTVAGGILIRVSDPDSFPSIGSGLWWAVQTLTTVGYGDVVPASTLGRLIGTVVMLNGIALLTVITAAVTASLIDQARRQRQPAPEGEDPAMAAGLAEIDARLQAIEAALGTRGPERDRP